MNVNNFCTQITSPCFQKNNKKAQQKVNPWSVYQKFSKNSKKPSPNVTNQLSKSTIQKRRKISIRTSIHQKQKYRDVTQNKNDMSQIKKIQLDDDKSDIKFILSKMKYNK